MGSGYTAYYTVEAINGNKSNSATESTEVSGFMKRNEIINKEENIPIEFSLSQNYPNPFNPITNISFSIKENANVELLIYDTEGQEVEKLVSNFITTGNYTVAFNAFELSSGVYYYRIIVNNFVQTRKLIVIK